jgi:hypothetical protein
MRAASLSLVLLALACTPSEDAPTRPEASGEPAASEPAPIEAEPTPVEPATGDEWFLGFVSQTGVEHCPKEFDDTKWLDVRSTLGFIPTSGASLETWMGKPVLAKGQAIPAPQVRSKVEPTPCPMMQMRSDWANSPQGMRVDRQNHPAIEHFFVTSAEPLEILKVTREGDELVVEFGNPLPFELVEVGLTVHYEGCYGKPGSMHRSSTAKPLPVGETMIERFSITAEDEPPEGLRKGGPTARVHLANSLELSARPVAAGPTLHVDLDVPLRALGMSLDCPAKSK